MSAEKKPKTEQKHAVITLGGDRLARIKAHQARLEQKVGVGLKRTAVVHGLLDKALDQVEAAK